MLRDPRRIALMMKFPPKKRGLHSNWPAQHAAPQQAVTVYVHLGI